MKREIKVRPSFSFADIALLSQCVEYKITAHVKAGDYNNPILLRLTTLKEYVDSFKDAAKSPMEELQAMLVKAGIDPAMLVKNNTTINPQVIIDPAVISDMRNNNVIEITNQNLPILDNPELTDEQKYDLLSLKGSANFNEEEEKWFLNNGTMIQLTRMSKKPINTDDL